MSITSNQSIGKSCIFQSKIVIDIPKSDENNDKGQNNDNNEYERQKTNINYSLKRDYTHDEVPVKKETKDIDDNFFRTETKFNPQKSGDQNNEPNGKSVEENKSLNNMISSKPSYNPKEDI